MRGYLCVLSAAGLLAACGGGSDEVGETIDAAACGGCITAGGECVSGTDDDACGQAGGQCAVCDATEVCADGVCRIPPACGPESCTGCCDGDTCMAGNADHSCGDSGYACETCNVEVGATCVGGVCEAACGPDTCGGCCDGEICVDGSDDYACGRGGGACSDCGSDSCSLGECVSASCAASCAGCCSGTTCLGGDATTACGTDGAACLDCGSNRVCEEGGCVVDPASRWDVVAVTGEVDEQNIEFEPWDSFGGLPDPLVYMIASQGPDTVQEYSSTDDDTLQPYWNDVVLEDVPARLLLNYFYIHVYDDDVGNTDDHMGQCAPVIYDSHFGGSLVTLDCPRDTTEGQAGFTVNFRIRPH